MEGFKAAAYRRVYRGLLAATLSSLLILLVALVALAGTLSELRSGVPLGELMQRGSEGLAPQYREMIRLTNALRMVLRFLSAIPVLAGLTDVLPASSQYRRARMLFFIRFLMDAVFSFVDALLLTLDHRDLVLGTASETFSLLRNLISMLDLTCFIGIGFAAGIFLLCGYIETLTAVGMEERNPRLLRLTHSLIFVCSIMAVAGIGFGVLWLAGPGLSSPATLTLLGFLIFCFLLRFIQRFLIVRETRLLAAVMEAISE